AHFAGSEYIALPSNIPSDSSVTVTFCVRTSASTPDTWPNNLFLVTRDIGFQNYDWSICLGQGRKIEFQTGTSSTDYVLTTPMDIASNDWVHVACVADSVSGTKKIYLNGQLSTSTSWAAHAFANSGEPILLGSSPSHPYFPGDEDEVRIYNRALSSDDIVTIYNANGPAAGPGIIT